MSRKQQALKPFKVDNQLIQSAPWIYGPRYKGSRLQLWLPGFEPPFGPFDEWATIALYSLLDPKNPGAPVVTTPTRLQEVLGFARVLAEVTDESGKPYKYQTFKTLDYRLVEETLNRLFTVEVRIDNIWKVKFPGQKGRPKNQVVQFRGRILQSYKKVWKPGVKPPEALPRAEHGRRKNVNQIVDPTTGEPGAPVWEYKRGQGPRPIAIEFRFAADMIRGLTGEDPNIGATLFSPKIFKLRKEFQKSRASTGLLFWVCRQTNPKMTWPIDSLTRELNLDQSRPGHSEDSLMKAFGLLKKAGVILDFKVDQKAQKISFERSPHWPLGEEEKEEPDQIEPPAKP